MTRNLISFFVQKSRINNQNFSYNDLAVTNPSDLGQFGDSQMTSNPYHAFGNMVASIVNERNRNETQCTLASINGKFKLEEKRMDIQLQEKMVIIYFFLFSTYFIKFLSSQSEHFIKDTFFKIVVFGT